MNEFKERMNKVKNIKFYIVELAYEDQEFKITNSTNPNHLQLRTKYALWHKENLINIGISKLLPSDWKAARGRSFAEPSWASSASSCGPAGTHRASGGSGRAPAIWRTSASGDGGYGQAG
jgi:hypothetical protein